MPARRDQLQAHRFQHRRAVAALVTGRPDPAEAPLRGLAATALSGLVLAAVLVAGCAALGLARPGPDGAWRAPGVVIVENETAALYVRLAGVLHPVVNYASAVLAVSAGRPARVVHVERRVLEDAPHGAVLGIRQLPVALPPAHELAAAPFTVCSHDAADAGSTPTLALGVGATLGSVPLAAGDAVVVQAPQHRSRYLLVAGRRHEITSLQVARALQLDTVPVLDVAPAVLDGVPEGAPLRTPAVPDAGARYPTSVAGHPVVVGRLLHDTADGRDLLVLADGVADLTPVQARLLETVRLPPAGVVAPAIQVSRTDLLDLPPSTTAWPAVQAQLAGLPSGVPVVSGVPARRGGLCAVHRGSRMAMLALAVPSAATPPAGVTVGRGGAALLRSGDDPGCTYLVADPGRRYAVPSPDVLAGFGYAHVTPTTVPRPLLALLPVGAALDPALARRAAPA